MATVTFAAEAVAAAGIWKFRSGEGQDIHVDVRKALRQFAAFFELKWELINGRPPSFASDPLNPFLHYAPMTLWNKTRDGRWVMPCNVYPKLELVQPPYSDVTIASVPFKMQCYSGAPMN